MAAKLVPPIEQSELLCKLSENLASVIYGMLDRQEDDMKLGFDPKLRYAAVDVVGDIANATGSLDPRDCLWRLGQARGHLYALHSLLKISHSTGRLEIEPEWMLDIQKAIKIIDDNVKNLPSKTKMWLREAYPTENGHDNTIKNVKIITFVPLENAADMRQALSEAGAGVIGKYVQCSFTLFGEGRFTPQQGAHPHVGTIGEPEMVNEAKIEVICERINAKQVIAALRKSHPYEEPAFDIIPLLDEGEL